MDPELASRLRRYGEQVEHVAIAAQADRPAPRRAAVGDDTDELPTVVPITAAPSNRRFRMITAAAAAAIVVVAGGLITWRITGDADLAPADSGPTTVNTTARPTTSTTTTTTTVTTSTVPNIGPGAPTSTTATTAPLGGSASTSASGTPPPMCPRYVSYGTSYPIQLCDRGPAVTLIQQHTGAPADGLFGPATRESVRVFQRLNGLNDDGLVGPLTWAAMFPTGAPGTDADGNGTVEPWEVP